MSAAADPSTGRIEEVVRIEMPAGETLRIQRARWSARGGGPRVAVVTGVHGDELEGQFLTFRLAQALNALAARDPGALLGAVDLYPAINPIGIDTASRHWPFFEGDLNRRFPGMPQGSAPQRVAHRILETLRGCALVVDIHGSNRYLRERPQARVAEPFAERLRPIAEMANLDMVWVHPPFNGLESTLGYALNRSGIPCLVIEMGIALRVSEDECGQVLLGLFRLLEAAAAVREGALSYGPAAAGLRARIPPFVVAEAQVRYANAGEAGLFVRAAEAGAALSPGGLLGRVVDPLSGEVREELRAEEGGWIFTMREYPICYPGSLVARYAVRA